MNALKFLSAPLKMKAIVPMAAMLISAAAMSQITPGEAVSQMVRGINMGNTLEAPYEGEWGNPPAEEVYFDLYRDAGFDVVRIPVRWHYHTDTEAPFHVEETWMDRVEEVVDWGLSRDLFIIINAHHEEWIKEDYANPSYRARFDSIWSQIAYRFRDKPEKLLFEIINEPYGLTREQNNELHQRVLSIIRRTNPTRNVIIQGHNWGGSEDLLAMAIPDDDYLIGSFHSYDPWPFGLEGTGSFGNAVQLQELDDKFAAVKNWSEQHGIPVLLGEFGCNRTADYNSRMRHYRAYVDLSLTYGFAPCAWDDGGSFRILLRSMRSWDEVKDILIFCSPGSPSIRELTLLQDTLLRIRWDMDPLETDSISVQRRDLTTPFATIATLDPDSVRYTDLSPVQGQQNYYRIIAHLSDGTKAHSHPLRIWIPVYEKRFRGYYRGAPLPVPGIVEAEDFDLGGEGLGYHDMDKGNLGGAYRPDEGVDIYDINGTGYRVGNTLPGEWLEYSVLVEQGGTYDVGLVYATIYAGGRFQLQVGSAVSDTLEVSSTGSWLQTASVSFRLELEEGEQIMRLSIVDPPLFHIDRMVFESVVSSSIPDYPVEELAIYQDAHGNLVIQIPEGEQFLDLRLINMAGSCVFRRTFPGPATGISTADLVPGVYLVAASGRERIYRTRIMIR